MVANVLLFYSDLASSQEISISQTPPKRGRERWALAPIFLIPPSVSLIALRNSLEFLLADVASNSTLCSFGTTLQQLAGNF